MAYFLCSITCLCLSKPQILHLQLKSFGPWDNSNFALALDNLTPEKQKHYAYFSKEAKRQRTPLVPNVHQCPICTTTVLYSLLENIYT
jgi:hypothetical protein